MILIGWVAKIDSTSQRSGVPCGASPSIILPGAGLSIVQWPGRGGGVGKQDVELGLGEKQGVAILRETAAPPGDLAHGRQPLNLSVEVSIDGFDRVSILIEVLWVHAVWTRAAVAWICSIENIWPRPEPGQTVFTFSQSCGVSRFSGQNGQV